MPHSVTPILGVDLDAQSSTKVFDLGTRVTANDGSIYEYVMDSGSGIDQYDAVKINDDWDVTSLTTTVSGAEPTRVGVAQIAITADYYAWVVVCGNGKVNALSSCAKDVKIGTTTTAGAIDDEFTDLINGLKLVNTESAGTTTATAFFAATNMTTNIANADSV